MQIQGSSVLLTGASGGLGQAMARELGRRGARLTLSGRNQDLLEPLAKELDGEVVVADLTDRADVDRLCEQVGDFDVVVANAGTGGDVALAEETFAHVDEILEINLRAPMLLATAFAQAKVAAGAPGQIVTIGSLAGIVALPETRLYNATKSGLRAFTLALRHDLHGTGVGATIVEPGFIRDAGMFANSAIDLPPGVRTKSPQDVANAVVRAIESNPAEIFVAPLELRFGATFGSVAPGIAQTVLRRAGAADRKRGGAA
jgi:short-subunit dehydrogenase